MDVDAHRFHRRAQDGAARAVELRVHQMRAEMDDMHFAAVVEQAARRLQPQQAAADHRRAPAALGACATMPLQSSSVRKPNTPAFSFRPARVTPSIGGMKARLPVAISSLS